MNRQVRHIMLPALGGVLGYLYYAFIGCTGGSCPLTGNPWMATGFGVAFGTAMGWQHGDKNRKEDNGHQENH